MTDEASLGTKALTGLRAGAARLFARIASRLLADPRNSEQAATYQALVESLSDLQAGVIMIENGRITSVNHILCKLLDYSEQEILGWPSYITIYHPDVRERIVSNHARRLRGERFETRYESAFHHRSGARLEIDMAATLIRVGERTKIVVIVRDITAKKQAEQQLLKANESLAAEIEHGHAVETLLRHSESRLRTITDNVPALIAYVDRGERYRFNNAAYRDWLGVDPASLLGIRVREAMGEEVYALVAPYVQRALAGERVSFDYPDRITGATRHAHAIYIPDIDADGQVAGFYVMVSDVTARKQLELHLQHRALHDPLTDLPNRAGLIERMEGAIARAQRNDKPLAAMFLDLDGFKQINDTLGHDAGDQLLRGFAARLVSCVRKTDTVARLAGDEFVVLLEGIGNGEIDAHPIAQKILDAMASPFLLGDHSVNMTASIGIAVEPLGKTSPEALLKRADAAMYMAKQQGGNRYALATG